MNSKCLPRLTLWLFSFVCLTSCESLTMTPNGFMPRDQAFANAVFSGDDATANRTVSPENANLLINGNPPIVFAAARGNGPFVDVLLSNGASLQERDSAGHSLVYAAASNGHEALAQDLMAKGSGSSEDLSAGKAYYESQKTTSDALGWGLLAVIAGVAIGAMCNSGSGSSNSGAEPSDNGQKKFGYDTLERNAGYRRENAEAAREGKSLPNPAYGLP